MNDVCDAKGQCAGTSKSTGAYTKAAGQWGATCCLIMTVVADGPVSAVQLYATAFIPDLSKYAVIVVGNPEEGAEFTDMEIGLPGYNMSAGETFTLTSDSVAFKRYFNHKLTNKSEDNLPKLTGMERLKIVEADRDTNGEILIDYFPPTNDSNTYNWKQGYAWRTLKNGWQLSENAFRDTGNTSLPLDAFSLFGPYKVLCQCIKSAKDTKDGSGKATCATATSAAPVTSFGPSSIFPNDEFGKEKWTIAIPGQLTTIGSTTEDSWSCQIQ
jgi:hypothetical protein